MHHLTATVQIRGEELLLHPLKSIFWQGKNILLLADLHLGKVTHFRKHGFPVPQDAGQQNWDKLAGLLLDLQPERVIFLGDLFHSAHNAEWEDLRQLIRQFHRIAFELVLGNHDILSETHYQESGLLIHREALILPPFLLTHEPTEPLDSGYYNLAGHIHPSVRLRGQGRQRLRLPCFYFGEKGGILPAFGAFTGTHPIQPNPNDKVFVVTDSSVIPC